MLMHMRLIVRESQKFNVMGWLTCDSVFHQNSSGGMVEWNVLNTSLHTADWTMFWKNFIEFAEKQILHK